MRTFLPFRSGVAGINNGSPAGHVVAGPFSEGEDPWGQYALGQLNARFPSYIYRRSATDYDLADLGECGRTDTQVHYFDYFVSAVGASVYPTALVVQKPQRPAKIR